MKNTQQSILFPVSALIPTKLEADIAEGSGKTRNARMALEAAKAAATPDDAVIAKAQADLDAAAAELAAKVPESAQKELAFFGAKLPSDDVKVTMRLGHVFYDLFLASYPEETAPLKKVIQQNRRSQLAEILDKDEFELPSYAVPYLRKALLDETFWNSVNLNVWVDAPAAESQDQPQKRFFTVNSKGSMYFGDVLGAAAGALYTEDMAK